MNYTRTITEVISIHLLSKAACCLQGLGSGILIVQVYRYTPNHDTKMHTKMSNT